MAHASTLVRVLEEDRELAAAVPGEHRPAALAASVAPVLSLQTGDWDPPREASHPGRDLGLLVIDGLLTRGFEVASRTITELRGPGDILRPWDDASEVTSVRGRVTWAAVEPTRLCWLDGDFAAAVAQW